MSEATKIAIMLMLLLPAILAIVGAVYLASREKEGWGWCIFVAILALPSAKAVIGLIS